MTFVPKFYEEWLRDLTAQVVTLCPPGDLEEGSKELAVLAALADALAAFDQRLVSLRNSRNFKAVGRELDDICRDVLSGLAISRNPPQAASGKTMRLERSDVAGELVIPAGTQYAKKSDSTIRYIQTEERTFPNGVGSIPEPGDELIAVRAVGLGKTGNAVPGEIERVVTSGLGITATNIEALNNGEGREEDASLAARLRLLLSALGRVQPAAVEYFASQYARHVSVYESAQHPAYAEVVVNKLNSGTVVTRGATPTSGVVPDGTATLLYFDNPAATEPFISIDGGPLVKLTTLPGAVVKHEQGVVEFIDGFGLTPGQAWTISGHKCYTGDIVTMQRLAEGNLSGDATDYGWRSAGSRLRFRPPIETLVNYRLRASFAIGVVPDDGESLIVNTIVEYHDSLKQGRRLRPFDIVRAVGQLAEVDNFVVLSPAFDVVPESARHAIGTRPHLIVFD